MVTFGLHAQSLSLPNGLFPKTHKYLVSDLLAGNNIYFENSHWLQGWPGYILTRN